MTSKSVSLPTTTTGTCYDSATACAVETIRVVASASACLIRILSHRVCISLILLLLLARKAVLGCACWHIIPSNKEVHLWAIRLSYLCRSCTSISRGGDPGGRGGGTRPPLNFFRGGSSPLEI